MVYCDETLHTYWYWQDAAQEIVKCHLGLAEALPRFKSEKQWNWPYLLKLLEYFDKIIYRHCYWRELDRGIAKCNLSSVEAMPRSKSYKQVNLTLPAFGRFWYASVQILKKGKAEKDITHFHMKKKSADTLRYHIFVCYIGSAILHFYVTLVRTKKISRIRV